MGGLRKLLFPFSILYDGVTSLRNKMFDWDVLKQKQFPVRIISVGNLSTGGTGKTPMIEWLVRQHAGQRVAILSRGYGRSTSGFRRVHADVTIDEVGDEPLQFAQKFGKQVEVFVCEKRADGIQQILSQTQPDVILLDDAYQHRYVQRDLSILLTTYAQPYFHDLVLPAGDLRESSRYADRADVIVVTKCPPGLSQNEQEKLKVKINPAPHQQVCFSTLAYGETLIGKPGNKSLKEIEGQKVSVVTGIARPEPFIEFLEAICEVEHLRYGDHHRFRESEIREIASKPLVITTEKDFMRLKPYGLENLYYLPIEVRFLRKAPALNRNLAN